MSNSNRVYGIDLGTTYSCIACVDEHGKPVVVNNFEGANTTPSVVYYESKDNIVVGEAAKGVANIYPDQVISTVKRVMGEADWHYASNGREYTPQEVSSHIIRKIVNDAQQNSGDDIQDVVITVPAYFGLNQKEATKQAGELAGLNVLYVIPEPTAAALAYGMEQQSDQTILVYDLGGGTFDVSIIEVKGGDFTVLCTGGIHKLGGKDWDELIAQYFAQCFAQEIGVDADELLNNNEAWQELLDSAEKCKKFLTTRESVSEKVSFDGEGVRVELTRDKFNELTNGLLEQTFSCTEQLIQAAADKGYDHIDKILLVGGSTYMPQVREGIESHFNIESNLLDPNQSVAKGAAIFGYKCYLEEQIKIEIAEQSGQSIEEVDIDSLSQSQIEDAHSQVALDEGLSLPGLQKMVNPKITNVTSKSFGIVVFDDDETELVTNLIIVDDEVPKKVTKQFSTFSDNQEGVVLRCFESIDRNEQMYQFAQEQQIGEAELVFKYALPKGSPIEVTFALTEDGLLNLHAKDLATETEIHADFNTASLLSSEELDMRKTHHMEFTIS